MNFSVFMPIPIHSRRWLLFAGVLVCSCLGLWFLRTDSSTDWQNYEQECRRLREQAAWPDLEIVSQRWSKAYPDRADPWLFRADAADGLKDLENEVEFLGRLPDSDPRTIDALIRKGRLESEALNKPWDCLKTCDRILTIDTRVLSAHQQSIDFCALTLQRGELIRRIRTAIRIRRESPQSYVLLAGASWYMLKETYHSNSHWLEGDPENETFQVARALHVHETDSKRHQAIAAAYADVPEPEELLEKFPHNLELLAYLLQLKITAGEVEDAEKIIEAAPMPAADNDPRFCRGKAWIHELRGETDQAEKLLRKSLAIDPYWRNSLYDLSQLLRRTGRIQEAEKFIVAHELARNLTQSIYNLKGDLFDVPFLTELQKLAFMAGDLEVANALERRLGENVTSQQSQ